MSSLQDGFKSLAVGGEGSGKTFYQWAQARKERHLVALEIHGDEKFKDVDSYVTSWRDFILAMKKYRAAKAKDKPYRVTWCIGKNARNHAKVLRVTIRALKGCGGGALFIDESESFIPANRQLTNEAFQLAKHSRHMKIKTYLTAHKPTELHNKIRTNVTKAVYFYTEDDLTIAYMARSYGLHHSKQEICNLLKELDKYQFLLKEKRDPLKIMKKIKNT